MKNKRVKRASGLIGLIFLLSCLLSSASPIFAAGKKVSAWDYLYEKYEKIMSPDAPNNFAKSTNPTDTDEDTPVLLCEENELLTFQSYDNQKTESNGGSSKLYVTDEPQNSTAAIDVTDDVVENLKQTTAGIYGLNGVQGVAFDPDKTGRRDHVAFVGIGQDKIPYLVIYNAVKKTWGSKYKINVGMDWIDTSDTNYYQIKDALSITAGDYNRDFHDTVVVFASFYGTDQDIFEFQVDDLKISQISDGQNGAALLHPNYIDGKYASYFYNKSNKWGRNQIHAQLETGDVNNDGVDDLVCLSWMNKPDKMTDNVFYYRTMSPYLNVSIGSKTATTVLGGKDSYHGQYVDSGDNGQNNGVHTTNTLYAPGLAIGKFKATSGNTIVIAGRGNTLTTNNKDTTCNGYTLANWVNMATVSLFKDGSLNLVFTTGAIQSMNELTTHTTKDKDAICSSTLEAVAFDGLDAADYLFFDGDIYKMASGTPELVQAFATTQKSGYNEDNKKWGDYGDITYISSSAIGNFDGESGFYETIYFTLMTKNNESQDDYHCRTAQIYGKTRDAITNQITEWACTETAPTDLYDKGDNFDQGLVDIVVAIDNDEDGTLLKYKDKQCYYTDPQILTILQASPYFQELYDDGLTDTGNSGITIIESNGKTVGEELSIDVSGGICINRTINSKNEEEIYESDNSASYNRNMTDGWEMSMYYSTNETFWATTMDQVIVYRTPIYVYSYYVWDPETQNWLYDDDDLFFSYVQQQPCYVQLGLDEYERFATAYNEGMAEKTAELKAQGETNISEYEDLTIISNTPYIELLDHEGDPYGYQFTGGRTISKNPFEFGHSAGCSGHDFEIGGEYTTYSSTSNGFTLSTEQRWAVDEKGDHVAVGFDFETSHDWVSSSGETKSIGLSYAAWVGNADSNAFVDLGYDDELAEEFNFTWDAVVYDTNIPGKGIPVVYDEDGNAEEIENVQIIGFELYNVTSAPEAPEVPLIAKYQPQTNSFKITWEKSDDATQGYRILRLINPRTYQYAVVGRVDKNTTSFTYDIQDNSSADYYYFAVQSLDGKNAYNVTAGLRSDNILGKVVDDTENTGFNIFVDNGAPVELLGKIGDYYKDSSTGILYNKTDEGWQPVSNVSNVDIDVNNLNITTSGVDINVSCGANVSEEDRALLESNKNRDKIKVESINEDIRQKALNNILNVMFTKMGMTDQDIERFLASPDSQIRLSADIDVMATDADIVGASAPFIEFSIDATATAQIVSESLGLNEIFIYEVQPSDFAENANVDVQLPICGNYQVANVVHLDENGVIDVYTEEGTEGSKHFTCDENAGVVNLSVGHFSNIRINGKEGTNNTNVNTGIMQNDQTTLCFAIGLLMLAGIACFVFVKKRMEE